MKKQIGKNTIGGGGKMGVNLRSYERSTHDLSYIWRSTMAPGVIVPFMKLVALRGDTFDINLEASALTLPTNGPLFASFKLQLDVFTADVRLYQGKLHNNTLNIGLSMNTVKLPQLLMYVDGINWEAKDLDNSQVNPSCIYKYLGISGVGSRADGAIARYYNAIPTLAYAEIYKNYYANKQETNGQMIHNTGVSKTITTVTANDGSGNTQVGMYPGGTPGTDIYNDGTTMRFEYSGVPPRLDQLNIMLYSIANTEWKLASEIWNKVIDTGTALVLSEANLTIWWGATLKYWNYIAEDENKKPQIFAFPLANIDLMREDILTATKITTAYIINADTYAPYGLPLKKEGTVWSKTTPLEGLFLKTYQSDVFNNWIKTESITGAGSINEITKIDTTGGNFTIDTLTFKRKVYNMLNAVALSGGSYDDWQDVNWQEESQGKPEIPVYHGGLSKEIVFQEVVSNSGSEGEPLGTIGGRGTLSKKHKGGYVRISAKEACVIMGIVSITPRIDYSQGNDWDVNLKTMDDFHKPALDGIGFQDLITDQMAWWDTDLPDGGTPVYRSAGKQPAWINYMTNYNKCFGNFAIASEQMFMTLNRRYQPNRTTKRIKDLTTYIDPANYNYIFADAERGAQNFWIQIGVNIEARRKMSAKIMPQG